MEDIYASEEGEYVVKGKEKVGDSEGWGGGVGEVRIREEKQR